MRYFRHEQFQRYKSFIYDQFGIFFSDDKKDMLQAKLLKLLVKNNLESYDDYFNLLIGKDGGSKLAEMANEITINKTDFFRENNHFEFIKKSWNMILEKNKRINRNMEIRAWSAGCSSGEEPYTLAMALTEIAMLQGMGIKILATDLSSKVIAEAITGVYSQSIKQQVEKYYILKYFEKAGTDLKVKESIKNLVTFRRFNLADDFPFKKSFDMIFCRNVMIYFDTKSQQRVIDKFYDVLAPGGLLFIGHSESLTNKKHKFQYIQPTIYMK